jgi:hypothetical protein
MNVLKQSDGDPWWLQLLQLIVGVVLLFGVFAAGTIVVAVILHAYRWVT